MGRIYTYLLICSGPRRLHGLSCASRSRCASFFPPPSEKIPGPGRRAKWISCAAVARVWCDGQAHERNRESGPRASGYACAAWTFGGAIRVQNRAREGGQRGEFRRPWRHNTRQPDRAASCPAAAGETASHRANDDSLTRDRKHRSTSCVKVRRLVI